MNNRGQASTGTARPAVFDLLTDSALLRVTSAAVYKRGETYAAAGAVEVISQQEAPRPGVHARVAGTAHYATEVWIDDQEVTGRCDCPHGEDGWFCKHQVAVALVWRARLSGQTDPPIDEAARKKVQASAKRVQTVKDRRAALREFLHGLTAAALADKLLDLAEQDTEISRELQQWRKLTATQAQPLALKPLIGEILSAGRDFISWRESSSYVRRAQAVLPLLRQARERDPAGAVGLTLYALRRSWVTLGQADDSNGAIGELCQTIGGEYVEALRHSVAQPAAFGETYLKALLEDPFGSFDADAAEGAMGDAALMRYRKALADRWRKAKDAALASRAERGTKSGTGTVRKRSAEDTFAFRTSEQSMELRTLERLHLEQLVRTGDIDSALAVLREDLSAAEDYSRVTRFLEAHGRMREAFTNAERAYRMFVDDWHLEADLLRCYERDGWTTEALALRRRQFDRQPNVERFHEVLRACAAADGNSAALREALMRSLEAREVAAMASARSAPRAVMRGHAPPHAARDVSLRAEILCSEAHWVAACQLVQSPAVCRPDVLRHIAQRLDDSHAEQALELLLRVFVAAMNYAASPYRAELALVAEIAQRFDPQRRAAWLARLRVEYKAKKNFMQGLPSS